MALVEIKSGSLHAGANLRKLEVGEVVEVDENTAQRWIETGKAKETDKKKGNKLTSFEVTTPSGPVSDEATVVQKKLDDANAQIQALKDQIDAAESKHKAELEAETKRADDAEAEVKKLSNKDK